MKTGKIQIAQLCNNKKLEENSEKSVMQPQVQSEYKNKVMHKN